MLKDLLELLLQVKSILKGSKDSDWSEMSVAEVDHMLSKAVDKIESGSKLSTRELTYLFAPTAPLQEIAMANDWVAEYMKLSEQFDRIMERMS